MIYDCIVIGGGPGGLIAGLYLARFYRNCLLFDDNRSRALLIPRSHNYPGFKHGITGPQILEHLRTQLNAYDIKIEKQTVYDLQYNKQKKVFIVKSEKLIKKDNKANQSYSAKNIILATGLLDIEPPLPKLKNAIQKGLIRHCAICDAYEVTGKRIAILCDSNEGIDKALFMKQYSKHITLFTLGKNIKISRKNCEIIRKNKIDVIQDTIVEVVVKRNKIKMMRTSKGNYGFDTVYSALGAKLRSELYQKLGVKCDKERSVHVSKKFETNIKGLYAVGDITVGLNQIVVAMAQGAVAACAINDNLNKMKSKAGGKTVR